LGRWKSVAVAANRRVSVAPHQVMMLPRLGGAESELRSDLEFGQFQPWWGTLQPARRA
jgi:hypothetical protein